MAFKWLSPQNHSGGDSVELGRLISASAVPHRGGRRINWYELSVVWWRQHAWRAHFMVFKIIMMSFAEISTGVPWSTYGVMNVRVCYTYPLIVTWVNGVCFTCSQPALDTLLDTDPQNWHSAIYIAAGKLIFSPLLQRVMCRGHYRPIESVCVERVWRHLKSLSPTPSCWQSL